MRLTTSLRSRSAADTAGIAQALAPSLGITRVADATGLDRLGLPVFFSDRPRGRVAKVHSGKGMTAADARVGALMEALEFAVAESAVAGGPLVCVDHAEWLEQLPSGLELIDFAPRLGTASGALQSMVVVPCESLASPGTTLLPAELVLVPNPTDASPPMFGRSSNGLASGNTLEEATLHALFEVLERDALAMNLARDWSHLLANAELPPPFAARAADWKRLGIELVVRFVPNELSLPCFDAVVHDPSSRGLGAARGSGLHFDRTIALSRAVCEAAQSRLRVLYESRIGGPAPAAATAPANNRTERERERRVLARFAEATRRVAFADIPEHACRSITSALDELVGRLAAAGFPRVFRRRLFHDDVADAGLHVVKVIVPRCESVVGRHVRMGPRLLARVAGTR